LVFETETSSITQYADDSSLHKSDTDIERFQNCLQLNLNSVINWCNINNMSFNPNKTKCMIVASKRKLNRNNDLKLNLLIGDDEIQNVTAHKILGIYVDNKLT